MIALLDTSQDLAQCAIELGCECGQLLAPPTQFKLRDPTKPWAIDNGAYSAFNAVGYRSLLEREAHHKQNCLFVTVPDVVGSARRTLEVFPFWRPLLKGWKIALACQDGQEHLPIPWDEIDAVFIGGSTNWKCSVHASQIVQAAKILGKWVHIGRLADQFLPANRARPHAARDVMQEKFTRWQLAVVIVIGALITWLINPAAQAIAIASAVAFLVSAIADWAAYSALHRQAWLFEKLGANSADGTGILVKSNGSNVVGAAVDSVLFPTLAFGAFLPTIIALQFVAKVGGGAVWSLIIHPIMRRRIL